MLPREFRSSFHWVEWHLSFFHFAGLIMVRALVLSSALTARDVCPFAQYFNFRPAVFGPFREVCFSAHVHENTYNSKAERAHCAVAS